MTSKSVLELNELNFESLVGDKGVLLVDFTAAWCAPCRALSPVLGRIADEMSGRILVASVDVDACPNLAAKFQIRGMPTLIVFQEGREVARRMGLTNEHGVRALLAPALSASPAFAGKRVFPATS
jgi:thioredoxin